jgi:hypothetical protein
MGEGPRLEGIRLGQRPGGVGAVPGLAGIDHHPREASRPQGCDHGALGASRGFEHHEGGRHGLKPCPQRGNPGIISDHRPTLAGGPQRDIAWGFRHINTNKQRWSRHSDS